MPLRFPVNAVGRRVDCQMTCSETGDHDEVDDGIAPCGILWSLGHGIKWDALVASKKVKGVRSCPWKSISELYGVSCAIQDRTGERSRLNLTQTGR